MVNSKGKSCETKGRFAAEKVSVTVFWENEEEQFYKTWSVNLEENLLQ